MWHRPVLRFCQPKRYLAALGPGLALAALGDEPALGEAAPPAAPEHFLEFELLADGPFGWMRIDQQMASWLARIPSSSGKPAFSRADVRMGDQQRRSFAVT